MSLSFSFRPEDQRPGQMGADFGGRLCPLCRQRDVTNVSSLLINPKETGSFSAISYKLHSCRFIFEQIEQSWKEIIREVYISSLILWPRLALVS